MPYRVSGNKVLHKKGGKWSIKQTCSYHENAIKAMGLLYGLESGSIKKKDVGKKRKNFRYEAMKKEMLKR